jgi:hypothetical protein
MMKFVRNAIMTMRVCVLIELILGILFWTTGIGGPLVLIHMAIGILVTLLLLGLGGLMAMAKGGDMVLAAGAFVLALCLALLGLSQQTLAPGPLHWLIQVAHLLLGLLSLGFAEIIVRQYKRLPQPNAAPQKQDGSQPAGLDKSKKAK